MSPPPWWILRLTPTTSPGFLCLALGLLRCPLRPRPAFEELGDWTWQLDILIRSVLLQLPGRNRLRLYDCCLWDFCQKHIITAMDSMNALPTDMQLVGIATWSFKLSFTFERKHWRRRSEREIDKIAEDKNKTMGIYHSQSSRALNPRTHHAPSQPRPTGQWLCRCWIHSRAPHQPVFSRCPRHQGRQCTNSEISATPSCSWCCQLTTVNPK